MPELDEAIAKHYETLPDIDDYRTSYAVTIESLSRRWHLLPCQTFLSGK